MEDKEQLEQEEDSLMSVDHRNWLMQPMTKLFVSNLHKHRESFIKQLSANAATIDELQIRCNAMGLKTIDAVISWTTNIEQFINQSKKQ
jgi:hypothetical protein